MSRYPEPAVTAAIECIRDVCERQPNPWRWKDTHEGRQITIVRAFMGAMTDAERWDVWVDAFAGNTHLLHDENRYAMELHLCRTLSPFFRALEPRINAPEVAVECQIAV